MSTLRLQLFSDFVTRLATVKWYETTMDGEKITCADVGQLGFTVYLERSPMKWSAVLHALDGQGDFVIRGETPHGVAAAKENALDCGPTLLNRAVSYILGIEDGN